MNEKKIMNTILFGSDWEAVLQEIVFQENMDPWAIDISKLADSFIKYLGEAKEFDFKIPARFILVAAILLRMKCDTIRFDEKKEETEEKSVELMDISDVPELGSPIKRKPTRKVMFDELVDALKKAFEADERKRERRFIIRHNVEDLIDFEVEDIEQRVEQIYQKVGTLFKNNDIVKFSNLVSNWSRKEIVLVLLPLLHLAQSDKINLDQEEMFGEIMIKLKPPESPNLDKPT